MEDRFKFKAHIKDKKKYDLDFSNQEVFHVMAIGFDENGIENITVSAFYDNNNYAVRGVLPEDAELLQCTGLRDNTKWNELTQEEKEDFYSQVCSENEKTIKYQNVDDVKHLWKGKWIYEGDIISQGRISNYKHIDWEVIGAVRFGIKDFSMFGYGYYKPCFYLEPSKKILDEKMLLKVSGNIYANRGLLIGK